MYPKTYEMAGLTDGNKLFNLNKELSARASTSTKASTLAKDLNSAGLVDREHALLHPDQDFYHVGGGLYARVPRKAQETMIVALSPTLANSLKARQSREDDCSDNETRSSTSTMRPSTPDNSHTSSSLDSIAAKLREDAKMLDQRNDALNKRELDLRAGEVEHLEKLRALETVKEISTACSLAADKRELALLKRETALAEKEKAYEKMANSFPSRILILDDAVNDKVTQRSLAEQVCPPPAEFTANYSTTAIISAYREQAHEYFTAAVRLREQAMETWNGMMPSPAEWCNGNGSGEAFEAFQDFNEAGDKLMDESNKLCRKPHYVVNTVSEHDAEVQRMEPVSSLSAGVPSARVTAKRFTEEEHSLLRHARH